MAKEYLIQGDTLTNIADKIRVLSGTEGALKLDDMALALDEVGQQTTLPELENPAIASDVLNGREIIDQDGNVVTGTMTNNGTISSTMDGINTKSITVPSGYTSGGTVSLNDTIDNEVDIQADLLEQIMTILESKTGYNTIYVGSSIPANDFGVNGDIYVVRGEG